MRIRKRLVVVVVGGVLAFATSAMAALVNGDMEGGFTGVYPDEVATGWTSYRAGTNTNFVSEFGATAGHPGDTGLAQKIKLVEIRDDRAAGIRQSISTTAGDALSFSAWAWCNIRDDGNYGVETSLRANWDGDTNPDSADMTNVIPRGGRDGIKTWYAGGPSNTGGNATGASVMLFLHGKGNNNKITGNTYIRWDDITLYHAHVPIAATIGGETASSLDVDVNPGDNAGNTDAEYAISIGGGAYALGSDWVQSDGSVAGSSVWQTDAAWGTETVTGLDPMTEYTFELMARYSSSITQPTTLGAGASGMTTPEPAAAVLALFGLGGLMLRRRRR